MTNEPEIEYLPETANLCGRFLACDLVSEGTAGLVYRAWESGRFYVVIDTRTVNTRFFAWLTGMKKRLVALRFRSRDEREAWLENVLRSASAPGFVPGSGSVGSSGAPVQPALHLTPSDAKRGFKA